MIKFVDIYQSISRRFGTVDEYLVLEIARRFFDEISLRIPVYNDYQFEEEVTDGWETLYEPYRSFTVDGDPVDEDLIDRPEHVTFAIPDDNYIGLALPNYFAGIQHVIVNGNRLSASEYRITDQYLWLPIEYQGSKIIVRTQIPMFPDVVIQVDSTLMFDAKAMWKTVLEDYICKELYLMPRFFNADLYREFRYRYEIGYNRVKSRLSNPIRFNIGNTL
jgi:hypothetical protein